MFNYNLITLRYKPTAVAADGDVDNPQLINYSHKA